jgi:hypothetical protein
MGLNPGLIHGVSFEVRLSVRDIIRAHDSLQCLDIGIGQHENTSRYYGLKKVAGLTIWQ